MRVAVLTRLFPNALEPLWSPFNKQQLTALGRLCDLEVLGVIPWFPGARLLGDASAAGRLARVPAEERIDGVRVLHPRYLFAPKVPAASAALYAASLFLAARRQRADVLFGSWAYPDGAATVMLARLLGVPSVVKVHGSDLNLVAKLPLVRAQLRQLVPRATRLVAVSRPLKDELVGLGADERKVAIVGNGVDHALFHPRDRQASRRALGLSPDGKLIVYVGRVVREKGLVELIEALRQLPAGVSLALVGDGAGRAECERAAEPLGARVRFAGARPLEEIPLWLGAADVFALPSWSEGTPNVLLEAFACGRRAVATSVGGIPDLMTDPALGEMVPPKDTAALAAALWRQAFAGAASEQIAAQGARGGWDESAKKLYQVLLDALAHRR